MNQTNCLTKDQTKNIQVSWNEKGFNLPAVYHLTPDTNPAKMDFTLEDIQCFIDIFEDIKKKTEGKYENKI